MKPISIALLLGVSIGSLGGVAATKQYYTTEIAINAAKQASSELVIANSYNDFIRLEQEKYERNQVIVSAASADAKRVRVRFPVVQRCADSGLHAPTPSTSPAPASGAFQPDLGAAFEQFRRDVEYDIVNACDQLNIEVRR